VDGIGVWIVMQWQTDVFVIAAKNSRFLAAALLGMTKSL